MGEECSKGSPVVKDANCPIFRTGDDFGVAELQAIDHTGVFGDGLQAGTVVSIPDLFKLKKGEEVWFGCEQEKQRRNSP